MCQKRPLTVDEIIDDLKKYIKPDKWKAVKGRMQALRFNVNKSQEFTEQAEELAEAFQRTLIFDSKKQKK